MRNKAYTVQSYFEELERVLKCSSKKHIKRVRIKGKKKKPKPEPESTSVEE